MQNSIAAIFESIAQVHRMKPAFAIGRKILDWEFDFVGEVVHVGCVVAAAASKRMLFGVKSVGINKM